MSALEPLRYYLVPATPGVAALLLVSIFHDPLTNTLEWVINPILGRTPTGRLGVPDPEPPQVIAIDLGDAESCDAGLTALTRIYHRHLSPSPADGSALSPLRPATAAPAPAPPPATAAAAPPSAEPPR